MNTKPLMRVVGYVRVSTEEQAREGVSLQTQREKIEAWAKALDGELLAIEEDAGSERTRKSASPSWLVTAQQFNFTFPDLLRATFSRSRLKTSGFGSKACTRPVSVTSLEASNVYSPIWAPRSKNTIPGFRIRSSRLAVSGSEFPW